MRHGRDEPRYQIGIAARMLDCHPQTLRLYEREGLIEPDRTEAGVRLYCDADIELLRRIQRFTQELGVNLAGVSIILRLLDQIEELQAEVERMRAQIDHGPKALGPARVRPRRRGVTVRIEDAREVEG
ncbi:MAG: MerR family transcriptional regulator [Armatimonadota bacterium]|nr:MerR family transcriptional regulator [Armatimonadota bacterium]